MEKNTNDAALVCALWREAVAAVSGEQSVANALSATDFAPDLIVAVGKAASGMCLGALKNLPKPCPALVVTKYQHTDEALKTWPNVTVIESAHPIPDDNSLRAGQALLEAVGGCAPDSKLLLLVSGGASALAESLVDDLDLAALQAKTDEMIAGGKTIGEINRVRKTLSRIKDGRLLEAFSGAEALVYAISDVEGDDIATIGSGLGDPHRVPERARMQLVGSNQIARDRLVEVAEAQGLEVKLNEEALYDDVFALAPQIASSLQCGAPGLYLWGGEPTILLPENPGSGGRNQSLALAIGKELMGDESCTVLVAGTDGTDGPTDAAGGLVDGQTVVDVDKAQAALGAADAGSYLRDREGIFITGPTNTNVMDLVVAIKR